MGTRGGGAGCSREVTKKGENVQAMGGGAPVFHQVQGRGGARRENSKKETRFLVGHERSFPRGRGKSVLQRGGWQGTPVGDGGGGQPKGRITSSLH